MGSQKVDALIFLKKKSFGKIKDRKRSHWEPVGGPPGGVVPPWGIQYIVVGQIGNFTFSFKKAQKYV